MKSYLISIVLFLLFPTICFAYGSPDYNPDHVRPRIYITDTILTELRALAHLDSSGNSTGGTPDIGWTNFINMISPYRLDSSGLHEAIAWHFALAYMLTRDTEYYDRAIEIVDLQIVDMDDELFDSFLYASTKGGFDVAVIYDWFYDDLTATQKTNYKQYMLDWMDMLWNPDNAIYSSYSKDNPIDNYYWRFMLGTTAITASLYGESPGTQTLVSDGVTYTDMVSFWEAKEAQFEPILNVIWDGGGWIECVTYGQASMEGMFQAFLAWKTASGRDWFTKLPEVKESAIYSLHAEYNDSDLHYHLFGDITRDPTGRANQFSRTIKFFLASELEGTTESEYSQYWVENHYTLSAYKSEIPYYFILGDESRTATNHEAAGLDQGYYAVGAGQFFWRESWTDTDTPVLMFNSGQALAAHQQHGDQNAFHLWAYGDFIISDATLYEDSGTQLQGQLGNSYLIDGHDQYGPTEKAYVEAFDKGIVRQAWGSGYAYVKGDATRVYTNDERYDGWQNYLLLDVYYRSIIQAGDYTFIYDKVSPKDSTYSIEYLLHTHNQPTVSDSVVTITNDVGGKGFHTTVLPEASTVSVGNDTTYYADADSWHISVEPITHSSNHYLLNVIEVAPSETTAPQAVSLVSGTNLTGALVDNTVALFSSTQTVDVTSASYTTNATTHYIADLPTNNDINVTRNGSVVSGSPFTSGIGGMIAFTATSGSATYSITADGASAPTCSDGLQNGDETGIDCGGSCAACATVPILPPFVHPVINN